MFWCLQVCDGRWRCCCSNASRAGQAFALLPSSDSLFLGTSESPGEEDPGGPASFLPCMLYIFSGLLCWRWARGPSLFLFACMLPIRAGPAPGCVPALPAGGGGAGEGPWVGPGHSRVLFSDARFKSRCCLSSLNSWVKCLYLPESCSCFGEGNRVMIGWL